ncbi:DUF402 domain-containing protein [Paenibacillus arenosi]|uniref:DUF402 domain-containing protein n=1 Tax=Paenibacillus arenosi TaxID=2774142 RepID=A0ABR9B529_9BACL|nr:DUF402 domain-containing protein [Paenibacillus arenosi]MBD8500527.1 DUF402 domain-containing protein [Paenibacillus arenosi]
MITYRRTLVKSFKHDGHLHRMWMENWIVPKQMCHQLHQQEDMLVLINCHTPIQEANGKQWISKVPAVTFFVPNQWFNIVALIEEQGIRYYCNIASPAYQTDGVITYIDYDLDVIRHSDGHIAIVDREEYDMNRLVYHYPDVVERRVAQGMEALMGRMRKGDTPFQDEAVLWYYQQWMKAQS